MINLQLILHEVFYQSIGEGEDYKFAFEIGLIHMDDGDNEIPELWLNGEKLDFEKSTS